MCGKTVGRIRLFADASTGDALHAASAMVARAVEDAGCRLHDLQREGWEDGALAAVALTLAIAASAVQPEFALPIFFGGMFVGARAVLAIWRRWDLLDRLLDERDAYALPAVRTRAEREAGAVNRRRLSRAIRSRLELERNPRVVANADQLAALAEELVDPLLELDPACAVACSRLLLDDLSSPLINSALPADDVRSQLFQIRSGFHSTD